jgi:hypothetical protein
MIQDINYPNTLANFSLKLRIVTPAKIRCYNVIGKYEMTSLRKSPCFIPAGKQRLLGNDQ